MGKCHVWITITIFLTSAPLPSSTTKKMASYRLGSSQVLTKSISIFKTLFCFHNFRAFWSFFVFVFICFCFCLYFVFGFFFGFCFCLFFNFCSLSLLYISSTIIWFVNCMRSKEEIVTKKTTVWYVSEDPTAPCRRKSKRNNKQPLPRINISAKMSQFETDFIQKPGWSSF